jgi:hypothetical protein
MDVTNVKIIDKIKKLLALGDHNPNENEAQAAILKAHALMAAHGISAVSTDEDISYSTEKCEHKGDRKFRRNLAAIIAPNFRCHNYLSGGRVTFFGRSNDAKIAKEAFEYAYAYAYRESNRLYAEYRRSGQDARGIVNSYAIGFVHGLKEKLDAQSVALMVITPPDVEDEYKALSKKIGMRMRRSNLSTSRTNRAVYNRGLADGRTVMNGRKLESAAS